MIAPQRNCPALQCARESDAIYMHSVVILRLSRKSFQGCKVRKYMQKVENFRLGRKWKSAILCSSRDCIVQTKTSLNDQPQ